MIVAGSGLRGVVATRPVDFRKGHDGLVAAVEHELGLDPYSGIVFVFRPKRMDRIKVLWWDGTGLVLASKRLEQGRFAWPAVRARGGGFVVPGRPGACAAGPASANPPSIRRSPPMSADTLPDDPAYAFCPAGDSRDDPFQIRIAVENMAVSIPTALVALSLADAFGLCDRLNRKLGLDRAAWTALVERCMHPAGGHTLH